MTMSLNNAILAPDLIASPVFTSKSSGDLS